LSIDGQIRRTNSHFDVVQQSNYIDHVMSWVDAQLKNNRIFPSIATESTPFPEQFRIYVATIFKRLFRVFAIIYTNHITEIKELAADTHLNTCYKHFVFFCAEFNLVQKCELEALRVPTKQYYEEFCKARMRIQHNAMRTQYNATHR